MTFGPNPLESSTVVLLLLLALSIQISPFDRLRPISNRQYGSNIAWVSTGGTLASIAFGKALNAVLGIFEMCEYYGLDLPKLGIAHSEDSLCIDSTEFMYKLHGNLLRESLMRLAEKGIRRVLLTSGTDKMAAIGSFLAYHTPPDMSIVVTGSMKSADHPDGDGKSNILFALSILRHLTKPVVLTCFNGKCWHAVDTCKLDAQNPNGVTCDPQVVIYPCPAVPNRTIPGALHANLLKFYPREPLPISDIWARPHKFQIDASSCAKYIPHAMAAQGYEALILISCGDCNLPVSNEYLTDAIADSATHHRLILTYSEVPFSQVIPPSYAGGQSHPDVKLGYRTAGGTDSRLQYYYATARIEGWTSEDIFDNWHDPLPGDIIRSSFSQRGD